MRYLVVVQPVPEYDHRDDYCMPMGIAYINGALREAGFDVLGLNMMFTGDTDPYRALADMIKEQHIDVLLCGGLTSELTVLRRVYTTAREANADIILIGGGGGFTSEPTLFSKMTNVDYAVIGEGERTDVALCRALEAHQPVDQIEGIVFRDAAGNYVQTLPRPVEMDLDLLPFPSYEGLSMEAYLDQQTVTGWYNYYGYYHDNPRIMPMLLSRSCPYRCSFCFHPIGNQYRTRSLDSFFKELDMWIEKYAINGIALIDECFSIDRKRVKAFCERIKPYHIAWACQMRADTYTDEMIAEMKEAGCIGACFGIESMSEKVLRNMQKHLDRATIENALAICYRHGIGCTGNLIFGAEVEDFESIKESIDWCNEHYEQTSNQPITNFDYIQTYPGSRYYEHAIDRGLIPDREAFIEKEDWLLNITSMPDEDYRAIAYIAKLCYAQTCNRGEMLSWSMQDDGRVTVTTRCFYCHQNTTYRNVPGHYLDKGRIRRLGCRHCNRLNEIVFNAEKYPVRRFKTIDWMLSHGGDSQGLLEKLVKADVKTVGLYGLNMATKYLLKQLRTVGMQVLFVTDKKEYDWMPMLDCPILSLNELPDADLIIVTDVVGFEKVRTFLREYTLIPAVSLEELL